MSMIEVSKDEFYTSIGQQNVHPHVVSNRYPYTMEWRLSNGKVIGKIVPEDGVYPKVTYPFYTNHYFVTEEMIPIIEQAKVTLPPLWDTTPIRSIDPDEL